jgi:hypothetical protein
MMMCDCDDDELAFVYATGKDLVAEIGSNGDAGDTISDEGILLSFCDVGIGIGALGQGQG